MYYFRRNTFVQSLNVVNNFNNGDIANVFYLINVI